MITFDIKMNKYENINKEQEQSVFEWVSNLVCPGGWNSFVQVSSSNYSCDAYYYNANIITFLMQ